MKPKGFSFSDISQRGGKPCPRSRYPTSPTCQLPSKPTSRSTKVAGCVVFSQHLYFTNLLIVVSPRLIGMGARAIGGTVAASHSELIVDELLGESGRHSRSAFSNS